MAEDLKKKVDELQDEQLDEVAGGDCFWNTGHHSEAGCGRKEEVHANV